MSTFNPHLTPAVRARSSAGRRRCSAIGLVAALALLMASCGSADAPITAPETVPAAPVAPATTPETSAAEVSVGIGTTELGEVLVGSNGKTLYGFTNDVDATSACSGTCADAWPPVIVDADFAVAPGLDIGIFATTTRDDGQLQLVAGKWPLYFFAGDVAASDIQGQGSGDVWFVAATDGGLIKDGAPEDAGAQEAPPAAAVVATGETEAGPVLVDADGLSLYGFTNDIDGVPSCADACADAWPPVLLDTDDVPEGLDPEVFSVVQRADASFQLSAGPWPLYRFAGDAAPGDINGQGSGDVWFLATPDGGLVRGDTPASATVGATPPTAGDGY